MRYEWTNDGLLLLGKRRINRNDPDCNIVFTDEECPAAERFVDKGMAKRLDPPPAPPVVKTVLKPTPIPTPAPASEVKISVGVMEATLDAGADGNFGTDDDTLVIKPKKSKAKPAKTKAKKPRKKAKK